MTQRVIRIATRKSAPRLMQAEFVKQARSRSLWNSNWVSTMSTQGDRILEHLALKIAWKGLFSQRAWSCHGWRAEPILRCIPMKDVASWISGLVLALQLSYLRTGKPLWLLCIPTKSLLLFSWLKLCSVIMARVRTSEFTPPMHLRN